MNRDHAAARIKEFRVAFESHADGDAYAAIVAALRIDPVLTWGEIVRCHSLPFTRIVENLRKSSEIEELLCSLHEERPEMIYISPPTNDPDIDEKVRNWRNANMDRGLPYFLFIPLAKSGSTFIGSILNHGFNLTCTTYSMINVHVIPSWARDYARGGSCYVTHLVPKTKNIKRLITAGITKAIVNIRDPRQVFLSFIHHINKYRSEFPEFGRIGFYDMSLDDQVSALIDQHEWQVQWISGWVAAEQQGMTLMFVSFEEFIGDREGMTDRMLEFYGGDTRYFDRDAAWAVNENIDYHFRAGEIDEWRRVLSPRVIRQLNENIPDHLYDRFGWRP